jgi:hypothetical protein
MGRAIGPPVIALLAFVASGCADNVLFTSGDASDLSDAQARAAEASLSDGPRGADGAFADARCFAGADGGGACRPNGAYCQGATQCCSGRCEQSYCLPPGTCGAPGAPCSTRSGCCSGRCEPSARSGALVCGEYCRPEGARCGEAQSCCSLGCNGGTCSDTLCGTAGTYCRSNNDCCSNFCPRGRCEDGYLPCLPSGEACGSETGASCCSGVCNTTTARCDLGPGGCREPSSPCNVESDCCRAPCAPNAQGVLACAAPCLGEGADCNSSGDCCNGDCSGVPSKCGGSRLGCL